MSRNSRSERYYNDSRHRDKYDSRRDRHRSRSRERDPGHRRYDDDEKARHSQGSRSDYYRDRYDARKDSKLTSSRTSSKNYSKIIPGYDKMSDAEKLKTRTRYQLKDSTKSDFLQSKSDREWTTIKNTKSFDLEVTDFREKVDMDAVNDIDNSETFVSKPFTPNQKKSQDSTETICKPIISHDEAIFGCKPSNVILEDAKQAQLQRNYALDSSFPSPSNKQSRWMEKLKSLHKKKHEESEE
ncbi:hypothetical protein TrispH2_000977 [Trichoplax sp. H2]|nr:hypothetical protein TrispH2_000977 [Trichoplax sp. H2]|eukprot:RDD46582.1 hypothetical protein TrispH2_000977 [Trichoplax sp. H2]